MFGLKFLAFMHFVTALRSLVIGTTLDTNVWEMPPKRKNPSSSSSSNWDTTRFAFEATKKRYKKNFFAASAISERGMFLAEENFNDVPILEVVSALKWNSFIEAPKQRGVSSIVREFYANYPDRKDGKEEENPDYKKISKELGCADAKPWIISSTSHKPKSIKLSKLHVSSVCWLQFIGHHIIPAGHFTNVTKERAFLTYCIKTKQLVDVIQFMMNQLDSELLMDLRGPICSATICEAQRKRLGTSCTELASQAPSSSVLLPAGPSSSSATPSSSDGLLAQLIQEQTKLIQEQSKLIEEQRKLLEDQRSASEARHQELVGELRFLKLRANYNTSCLDSVEANVREFIGFIANEIKFPKYRDCPPLPPEL
ncbi:hypothetical protein G2W53_004041 [Senna tora]|uniref:Uncharacterized protein n=1 Tax=Senna tora TaxID=362788 RepID=A0A834XC95_9FABA|nr:hypothetical protein G2W53_004041 [Senna tora]